MAAHLRDVRVDTYLVTVMSESLIRGLQANNQTAACMKHFVAYSKTPTGRDKDGTQLSDFDLLNYFVPPFKAAIAAGVKTAMENYISINGVPVIGNHKILQQLLREDLGFTGLTVSDFDEFGDYSTAHRIARNVNESIRFSYNLTGIDMSMAYDTKYLNATKALLEQSPEYLDRLKESAHRIINTKLQVGLFDNPMPGADLVHWRWLVSPLCSCRTTTAHCRSQVRLQSSSLATRPTISVTSVVAGVSAGTATQATSTSRTAFQ